MTMVKPPQRDESQISVRLPSALHLKIKDAADRATPVALSVNQWVLAALAEKLERDQAERKGRR